MLVGYRSAGCASSISRPPLRPGREFGGLVAGPEQAAVATKMPGQPHTMTETETLCNGRWLRLKRRGRWEFAERVNAGGGVIIVAVTPDDRVLLVEQYRAAIEKKDHRDAGRPGRRSRRQRGRARHRSGAARAARGDRLRSRAHRVPDGRAFIVRHEQRDHGVRARVRSRARACGRRRRDRRHRRARSAARAKPRAGCCRR